MDKKKHKIPSKKNFKTWKEARNYFDKNFAFPVGGEDRQEERFVAWVEEDNIQIQEAFDTDESDEYDRATHSSF